MARIYSHDGYIAADGLQGCETCDEALQLAQRLADEWGEWVELHDDDGTWRVHPAVDGVRAPADPVADDYASCDACGAFAYEAAGCAECREVLTEVGHG
jgi:hypothetical protein